jgi:hypothetical protein
MSMSMPMSLKLKMLGFHLLFKHLKLVFVKATLQSKPTA